MHPCSWCRADADRSCAFGHVAICLLQTTTDNFLRIGGTPEKISLPIFQRTVSSKNLVPVQGKISLPLYNGQIFCLCPLVCEILLFTLQRTFFQPISGYDRQKILIRKSPSLYNGQFFAVCPGLFKKSERSLLLYNGQIFANWGDLQKSFQFTTDISSEKNRGLLEKSENKNAPGL